MGEWSNLTQREKANIIRFAIKNGVSDINQIRDTFNVYASGNGGENEYKEGGSIYIKPSKRGTFTAAATKHGKSVQEFARQVLANKENYSPAMVKKANFARNAAGWKHSTGGPLYPFSFQKQPLPAVLYKEGGNTNRDSYNEYRNYLIDKYYEENFWKMAGEGPQQWRDAAVAQADKEMQKYSQKPSAQEVTYSKTLPEVTVTPNGTSSRYVQPVVFKTEWSPSEIKEMETPEEKMIHYAPHAQSRVESDLSKIAAGAIGIPMLATFLGGPMAGYAIDAAASGSTGVGLRDVYNFVKSPIGREAIKKATVNTVLGGLGGEAINSFMQGVTGSTVGQNIANATNSIPYVQNIPYNAREFVGEFFNPGYFVSGPLEKLAPKVSNISVNGIKNSVLFNNIKSKIPSKGSIPHTRPFELNSDLLIGRQGKKIKDTISETYDDILYRINKREDDIFRQSLEDIKKGRIDPSAELKVYSKPMYGGDGEYDETQKIIYLNDNLIGVAGDKYEPALSHEVAHDFYGRISKNRYVPREGIENPYLSPIVDVDDEGLLFVDGYEKVEPAVAEKYISKYMSDAGVSESVARTLDNAFKFPVFGNEYVGPDRYTNEKLAEITSIRRRISMKNNNVRREALDDIIKNLSNKEIDDIMESSSGYSQQWAKSKPHTPEYYSNIKKALLIGSVATPFVINTPANKK